MSSTHDLNPSQTAGFDKGSEKERFKSMELERCSDASPSLSLKWGGEHLAFEDTRTCLLIACCRCERIPALLFVRPYCAQRKWNVDGEIEITMPPTDDAIPQWPKKVFQTRAEFDGGAADRGIAFGASTLCIPDALPGSLEEIYPSPVVQSLCQQDVLNMEVDEDVLFVKLNETRKDEIWNQISPDDRLLAWYDLLTLIVYSYPDVYGEFRWQEVLASCKPVIDSTIMPFLSVLDLNHLQNIQAILHRLIPFLMHYSIFDGFGGELRFPIKRKVLQAIKHACEPDVRHMTALLGIAKDLVWKIHSEEQQSIESLFNELQFFLGTARSRGLLGFIVLAMSRSIQAFLGRPQFVEAARLGRLGKNAPLSTIERLSRIAFSISSPSTDGIEALLEKGDIQINFAVASILIEHNNYIAAYGFLNASVGLLGAATSSKYEHYFAVIIELVKCCNALGKNAEAEARALRALEEHSLKPTSEYEVCCLRIALADSRIGQGKYSDARRILQDVLTEDLSVYLRQAVNLRLNKVERRLGTRNTSAFTGEGSFLAAMVPMSDLKDDMRHECLDELSSTLHYIQQSRALDYHVSYPVSGSKSRTKDNDTLGPFAEDWQISFLQGQIQRFNDATPQHHSQTETGRGYEILSEQFEKILDPGHWAERKPSKKTTNIPSQYLEGSNQSLESSGSVDLPRSSVADAVEDVDYEWRYLKYSKEHSKGVKTVAFSPNGKQIASGSWDRTIKLWDIDTMAVAKTLEGHSKAIMTVAFSPDGKQIASGSCDRTIKLWAINTGAVVKTLIGHSDWVRAIAPSPNRKQIASGSNDKTIKLWDIDTGAVVKTLIGHLDYVKAIAFSPNRKQIASGSNDKTIKLWDIDTGAEVKTLIGHLDIVGAVAFSPNGKQIASGSADTTIKLWDLDTGAVAKTLRGHANGVWTVAFSPDGKQIASGSDDTTIKLWDLDTGAVAKTLEGHWKATITVAFSPDGNYIASGSDDKTIRLWHKVPKKDGTLVKYLKRIFQ